LPTTFIIRFERRCDTFWKRGWGEGRGGPLPSTTLGQFTCRKKTFISLEKKNNDHGLDVSIVVIKVIIIYILKIMAFKTIIMKYVYNGIYIALYNKVISYN